MRMTIHQYSDLIEGKVVAERLYSADAPGDVIGALRLGSVDIPVSCHSERSEESKAVATFQA